MVAAVEICVEGVASAIAAVEGGAGRVELCANLAVGGITPSPGMIRVASAALTIPLHVLIRPRGGPFVYGADEFEVMLADVEYARESGSSGVVLGVLTGDGRVDREAIARLIEAARPMSVTFHKAFDAARDPLEALDDLSALGVNRVLTSGGAATARQGVGRLAELTRRSAGRVAVMAGGSIAAGDVRPLVDAGVREIHVGSAASRDGATDRGRVRAIVEAAAIGEIVHITTRSEWDRAVAEGVYRADSLAAEGFIHASNPGQVAGSAGRFFRGRAGLVVLRIDPDRVHPPIRREASTHSAEPFPHIHGPLNLCAVFAVEPLVEDGRGDYSWPPG